MIDLMLIRRAVSNLMDAMEPRETVAAINDADKSGKVIDEIVAQAIGAGEAVSVDDHAAKVNDLGGQLTKANEALDEWEASAPYLYSAICENRRDDAIAILSELTGERFRSIREQRNLFPERIPA